LRNQSSVIHPFVSNLKATKTFQFSCKLHLEKLSYY
jgi:hypothetical protein